MKKFTLLVLSRCNGRANKTNIFCSILLAAAIPFSHNTHALDVECSIPNHVVCQVSDPKGFMSVTVNVDFGNLGTIDIASYTFPNCRTETTVSWDSIVPNFEITTTPCKGGGLTLRNNDNAEQTNPFFAVSDFKNNVAKPAGNITNPATRNQKFTIGVSQLQTHGGLLASVKFCDNTKVDDDIASCDIGEIAWTCPDGASGPSEVCEADVHGEFGD